MMGRESDTDKKAGGVDWNDRKRIKGFGSGNEDGA